VEGDAFNCFEAKAWRRMPHANSMRSVRIRKGLEQYSIDDAENGAVRADAGRQC